MKREKSGKVFKGMTTKGKQQPFRKGEANRGNKNLISGLNKTVLLDKRE
jgi:hypothetical protein